MFEQTDKIRREYTDQYVTVIHPPAKLQRFHGMVGQVKTVNQNGKALVEFLNYRHNIGWYDIDLEYLKVVDQPAEPETVTETKTAPSTGAKRARQKAGLSPLEQLRQQGGKVAVPPAAQKGLSPIEQLRQQGAKKSSTAAPPDASANPKKKETTGLSPIEILRQQGAKKSSGTAAAAPLAKTNNKQKQGLSPIEILRQQGAKKSSDTAAAAPLAKTNNKQKQGLSPIEVLRQQGAKRTAASAPPPPPPPATESPSEKPVGQPTTAEILAQLRASKKT